MFGHDKDEHDDDNVPVAEPLDNSAEATVVTSDAPTTGPTSAPEPPAPAEDMPAFIPTPVAGQDEHDDDTEEKEDDKPEETPLLPASTNSASNDELLDLKKDALEELAPLVDHLDQNPEERFKTTMMMIQATDASGLIPNAYEAAKKIEDEKIRAQALLDIVNEINYFTQAKSSN